MSEPITVSIDDLLSGAARFDALLDTRSPSEYRDDHLPHAISTPVLDDEERARVGTLYKQSSSFAAKRVGACLVARNIASVVEHLPAELTREWRPLVYCWRGGNRSGALATVLAHIGWRTAILTGGYREFRRRVVAELAAQPEALRFVVLAGPTGSGKSRMLAMLAERGAQVLDLEGLARHRGSVLGDIPEHPQPSQKAFETGIWHALRKFDPRLPVFVESESKKVGRVHVPDALMAVIRASECAVLDTDDSARVALLRDEYRYFVDAPRALADRLAWLEPLHGRAKIAGWLALAEHGDWNAFVLALLHQHYDPAYRRSMNRNFARMAHAESFGAGHLEMGTVADAIIDRFNASRRSPSTGSPDCA